MPRESSHVEWLGLGVATLGIEDEAQAGNGYRELRVLFSVPLSRESNVPLCKWNGSALAVPLAYLLAQRTDIIVMERHLTSGEGKGPRKIDFVAIPNIFPCSNTGKELKSCFSDSASSLTHRSFARHGRYWARHILICCAFEKTVHDQACTRVRSSIF
jgi:hypothetical protein